MRDEEEEVVVMTARRRVVPGWRAAPGCGAVRRGGGSSVQRFSAPQAWLWQSVAGIRAASWSWSRGEARVAAAAELLRNIAPTNPLPHLASAGWALLFFCIGLTYTLQPPT